MEISPVRSLGDLNFRIIERRKLQAVIICMVNDTFIDLLAPPVHQFLSLGHSYLFSDPFIITFHCLFDRFFVEA